MYLHEIFQYKKIWLLRIELISQPKNQFRTSKKSLQHSTHIFATQQNIFNTKTNLPLQKNPGNTKPISSHLKKISSTLKPISLFKKILTTLHPYLYISKKFPQHCTDIFSSQKNPYYAKPNLILLKIFQKRKPIIYFYRINIPANLDFLNVNYSPNSKTNSSLLKI
jgi:hypothetical protein